MKILLFFFVLFFMQVIEMGEIKCSHSFSCIFLPEYLWNQQHLTMGPAVAHLHLKQTLTLHLEQN